MRRRRAPITIEGGLGTLGLEYEQMTYAQRYAAEHPTEPTKEYEQLTYAERYQAEQQVAEEQGKCSVSVMGIAKDSITEGMRRAQILIDAYGHAPRHGDAIRREFLEIVLLPPLGRCDGEGNYIPPVEGNTEYPRLLLALLDKYGLNSTAGLPEEIKAQLPHRGLHHSPSSGTFLDQVVDFVTHPAFLLAVAPVAIMLAAPAAGAGAAAGGTEGAAIAGELTAAEWGAGLTAEQIGGGALAEGAATAAGVEGALSAAEWEAISAGWEGLAAESSLQNVALAEIAGDVSAGTLAQMIGSDGAAEMLAQGATILGPESAVATTWYSEAGQAVANKLTMMGKQALAAELQSEFMGAIVGEPASGASGGDYNLLPAYGSPGYLDLEGDGGALPSGWIRGTLQAAAPLTIGAGLGLLALFLLGADDERN